ncbi:MAG: hypothetical protein IJB96_00905 [Lachnospira sp.]|nr:hypothetical protein [Lachnospira sp.]
MKKNIKRFAALAVVVLWGILIILTLLAALIDNDFTRTIFPGLIFTIIVLPVVAYAMLLVYRILSGRKADDKATDTTK